MTGFNMPPGCSPSDIPGNRPEDQASEAFYEWVYDKLGTKMSDPDIEVFAAELWLKMGEAYQAGYSQGQADEAMAQEFMEEGEPAN